MVDLVFSTTRLLLALFLVVLNGFFVASEFAFVRIRATSVEQLVEDGRAGAGTLQEVVDNLDNYLAVTQLGITIASLGLGWVGEPAVASLLEPVLESVLPSNLIHLVAFALGFSIITFLHVVFGELAPKTIAIAEAERLSLFVAPPMKFFYILFYPGLVVFNGTANAFTRLLGIPPASETEETLEEREIRRVLARSGEKGHVDTAEVEMIESVFDLDDTLVREVMVPRPDVVSVTGDATLTELRSVILDAGHTRYPVISEDGDEAAGFLDVKDVLRASEADDEGETTADDIAREILVVPETTTISDLLLQFRANQQQMAAVIDEWGAFEGIATIEDVVEAVVGDLRDEFDTDESEPSIRQQDEGVYEIDGGVPLSVVNDTLDADFESEGFETLGGLILERLDRTPELDDTIEEAEYTLTVTGVDGARIVAVRVEQRG
ncbi:hemolysin family protein [Halovenus marina]|uniref:hemolysin family protein n=1 Tax=Halovenus marina TaxID=3396621 RepID=UPI003F565520